MISDKQYTLTLQAIIECMEQGYKPWERPWKAPKKNGFNPNLHHNAITGRQYSGLNVWSLAATAMTHNWQDTGWLTFNAANKAGGTVKKGEHGTYIHFWKVEEKLVEDKDTGEAKMKKVFVFVMYKVFNVEQTENVKLPKSRKQAEDSEDVDVNELAQSIADRYIENGGPTLRHDGFDRAYYVPSLDTVSLPEPKQFNSVNSYHSTMFHELGHSTGHEKRLARLAKDTVLAPFGSEDYSREELVAEFTAAFLSAASGVDNTDTRENSAAYIKNWLQVIKKDMGAVMTAASKAQKAANLILGIDGS